MKLSSLPNLPNLQECFMVFSYIEKTPIAEYENAKILYLLYESADALIRDFISAAQSNEDFSTIDLDGNPDYTFELSNPRIKNPELHKLEEIAILYHDQNIMIG